MKMWLIKKLLTSFIGDAYITVDVDGINLAGYYLPDIIEGKRGAYKVDASDGIRAKKVTLMLFSERGRVPFMEIGDTGVTDSGVKVVTEPFVTEAA